MKRRFSLFLAIAMAALLLAGCGREQQVVVSASFPWETELVEDFGLGIQLYLPKDMLEQELLRFQDPRLLHGGAVEQGEGTQAAPETARLCCYMSSEGVYPLFGIARYEMAQWETLTGQGLTPEQITGADTAQELFRKNELIYLFTQTQVDIHSLSGEGQEDYRQLQDSLPAIRAGIMLMESAGEMHGAVLPDFSVETLTDETGDKSIFSGYSLTMVNVWGTFCSPCIEEMPMLEELSQAMPEGTQLVGIVCDIKNGDTGKALQILKETGVTFPNLIATDTLLDFLEDSVSAYPTTFFVDEEGAVIGDAVIGARSRSVYERILKERLAMLPE